jgi:hypothetical protein
MMTLFKSNATRDHERERRLLDDLDPVTSPLPQESYNSFSMNGELNLIRAVSEHGTVRITAIDRELEAMRERTQKLTHEKSILEKLVAVVNTNQPST